MLNIIKMGKRGWKYSSYPGIELTSVLYVKELRKIQGEQKSSLE